MEFEDNEAILQALLKQGKRCVEDGAECILLGCAGYTAFAEEMRQELGVLVLDGVVPAVKLCESLVDMALKTPKKKLWAYPDAKEISGFYELIKY